MFVACRAFAIDIAFGGNVALGTLPYYHMFVGKVSVRIEIHGNAFVKNVEFTLELLCRKLFHVCDDASVELVYVFETIFDDKS